MVAPASGPKSAQAQMAIEMYFRIDDSSEDFPGEEQLKLVLNWGCEKAWTILKSLANPRVGKFAETINPRENKAYDFGAASVYKQMENLVADLKHAFRLLRQAPGFTLTAITVIALGIGANTAIFSVVNSVLLKPLPYPEPDRIVTLGASSPQGSFFVASPTKYNAWRQMTQVFDDIAAYDFGGPGVNITGGDRPEQVKGIHVSHEFFRLFGVPVTLGRGFTQQEDMPEGGKVVVLSNGLWQRRFGGDPNIVGKTMGLGGDPYTIIGVVAAGFAFETPVDLYLPFQADPNSTNQGHFFFASARLKPGVGLKAAQDALAAAAAQYEKKFPGGLGPGGGFAAQLMSESVVA